MLNYIKINLLKSNGLELMIVKLTLLNDIQIKNILLLNLINLNNLVLIILKG